MTELVLRPLADAFMSVGVWVALMVLAFGVLQWRTGNRVMRFLAGHRAAGPLIGALLGVSPGCGGAILVMPLYVRGTVSFGTVIAALVATMGDSSWVIFAASPETALYVHGILLVAGIVTGYLTDAVGFAPRPIATAGRSLGAAEAFPPPRRLAPGAITLPPVDGLFWVLAGLGFVVGAPILFHLVDVSVLAAPLGGLDPYLTVGVTGTLVAVVVFARSKGKFADDSEESAALKRSSLAAVLKFGASETAFVTFWVATVYLAYTWITTGLGIELESLRAAGFAAVLLGAAIGLIPGCAPQIVLTTLYLAGGLSFPALIANALSQDGDALFPLLAMDRRSAVTASALTTIPAVVVGTAALWLSS
jgi:hypothetical protein